MSPLNSLLATFGLTAIIEAGIQGVWTADFRKLESVYAGEKFRVGALFVPVPELADAGCWRWRLRFGIWAAMRYTNLGRALRALAEDAPVAAAFGINARAHALCCPACAARSRASPACASRSSFTLTPVADLCVGRRRVRRR